MSMYFASQQIYNKNNGMSKCVNTGPYAFV